MRIFSPRGLLRALALVTLVAFAGAALLLPQALRWQERREVLGRTASVITAVRDLAQLVTAEYHIERVIDLRDQQQALLGLVAGEDAILLVAAGDVSAGLDLGALQPGDVAIAPLPGGGARVTLRLPRPRVLRAALDEKRTYVHTRRTDLLARRDERLEGRAREVAVASFERAAADGGILDRAQAQAERVLRALLRDLGFAEVVLDWR